jgi:hypothetical protein
MYCTVWPAEGTVWFTGRTVNEVRLPVALLLTVRVAVPVTPPLPPVAVMVVVPSPVAVASPVELMVATLDTLEVQVTWSVRFCMFAPPFLPFRNVPVAWNCAVLPAFGIVALVGVTTMELSCGV